MPARNDAENYTTHDGVGESIADVTKLCEVASTEYASGPTLGGFFTPAVTTVRLTLIVDTAFRLLKE